MLRSESWPRKQLVAFCLHRYDSEIEEGNEGSDRKGGWIFTLFDFCCSVKNSAVLRAVFLHWFPETTRNQLQATVQSCSCIRIFANASHFSDSNWISGFGIGKTHNQRTDVYHIATATNRGVGVVCTNSFRSFVNNRLTLEHCQNSLACWKTSQEGTVILQLTWVVLSYSVTTCTSYKWKDCETS